jgi:3-isopropylmalate dehydratase small subunit
MKYFNWIFYAMLIVAGILTVSVTQQMEERFRLIESQIDEMTIMLKDMTNE